MQEFVGLMESNIKAYREAISLSLYKLIKANNRKLRIISDSQVICYIIFFWVVLLLY